MRADDRAGIQHAVAAHLYEIAQHGTEFLQTRLNLLGSVLDYHQSLVGLDVGGQTARTHVRLVAQDAVADVVVVGSLDIVEENYVFQLHGVANNAVGTYQGAAPDEGTVAHLGAGADDAGSPQIGRGSHDGGIVYPNRGGNLRVVAA